MFSSYFPSGEWSWVTWLWGSIPIAINFYLLLLQFASTFYFHRELRVCGCSSVRAWLIRARVPPRQLRYFCLF